jgi:hypothetical protein
MHFFKKRKEKPTCYIFSLHLSHLLSTGVFYAFYRCHYVCNYLPDIIQWKSRELFCCGSVISWETGAYVPVQGRTFLTRRATISQKSLHYANTWLFGAVIL